MLEIPLAWLQLKHNKARFIVALGGIAFAVVLILMQLGFRASLFESAVRYQERLDYDLALFNTESTYIGRARPFTSRRLYQALGVPGVESVSPVYVRLSVWKNPYTHDARSILVVGIDPSREALRTPGIRENLDRIRQRDVVLFDAGSRPEHGPIAERFRAGDEIFSELNDRRVRVGGLFLMGTSFGIDGSIVTSETNFLRIFPERERTQIDVGLIKLEPGRDPDRMREAVRALLPRDVVVLTKADFVSREKAYWNANTPIGYVFSFGAVIGFVVGAIIVYQILFADVADHLPEYATLKAIGYSNRFVAAVVVQQAVILAILGYVPGVLICLWLYGSAGAATRLPMYLTPERGIGVLLLTVAMCGISGLMALRKVRAADPAEIF